MHITHHVYSVYLEHSRVVCWFAPFVPCGVVRGTQATFASSCLSGCPPHCPLLLGSSVRVQTSIIHTQAKGLAMLNNFNTLVHLQRPLRCQVVSAGRRARGWGAGAGEPGVPPSPGIESCSGRPDCEGGPHWHWHRGWRSWPHWDWYCGHCRRKAIANADRAKHISRRSCP